MIAYFYGFFNLLGVALEYLIQVIRSVFKDLSNALNINLECGRINTNLDFLNIVKIWFIFLLLKNSNY